MQTENTCLFATFSSILLGRSWTLQWISLKLYDEYTQTLNFDRKAHLVLNEIARSRFPRKSPDSLVIQRFDDFSAESILDASRSTSTSNKPSLSSCVRRGADGRILSEASFVRSRSNLGGPRSRQKEKGVESKKGYRAPRREIFGGREMAASDSRQGHLWWGLLFGWALLGRYRVASPSPLARKAQRAGDGTSNEYSFAVSHLPFPKFRQSRCVKIADGIDNQRDG